MNTSRECHSAPFHCVGLPAPLQSPESGPSVVGRGPFCVLASRRRLGGRAVSQAIVDPAELRRFALNLKRFNEDLQTTLAALHAQLLGLADTWRDQEHAP